MLGVCEDGAMARIEPLAREDLAEFEPGFEMVEQMMGFVPNSMFTMARVPGLLPAFQGLGAAVLGNPIIPRDLAQMVAMMVSVGAGCRYCQAHTGHTAARMGVSEEKLEAIWHFETSDHFTEGERAALRIAFHAGQVPNAATDEHFATAKEHFSDEEIAAIVAVCSFFGYLNRWNDTMATTLEAGPTHFGETVIASNGWEAGKHG